AAGRLVVGAELALEHTVDAANLLLLAKANAVLGELDPALPVLAGRIGTPVEGALVRVAALALEEELEAFAAAELAGGSVVASHDSWFLVACSRTRQTRRRLGGRQPLCGMGVTSRISVTFMPTVWKARSADSRPAPGPFTKMATDVMPWSAALRAASSAANCAANGVLLREPLNP